MSVLADSINSDGGVVDMGVVGDTLEMLVIGNEVVVTSLQVAETFGKDHKNVLRDIEGLVGKGLSEKFWRLNFEPSSYVNSQNKAQPAYNMTKDGFSVVAMGYTTPNAMAFKEAYINEFNRRGELLKGLEALAMKVKAEQAYYLANPGLVEYDD